MKRNFTTILIIIIFLMNININLAYGEGESLNIIDDQIKKLNTQELENILKDINSENDLLPEIRIKDFLSGLIKGDISFKSKDVGKYFLMIFFDELRISLSLLSKILVITLISSILTNLQSTFENESISELANYIIYALIGILVISNFSLIMDLARTTIYRMVDFMQVILPILLTLLTAVSGPNTRILFHPMILISVNFVGVLIKTIIFPLIYFSFIISVIGNVSNRIEFSKIADLARQIIGFMITGAFTLFVGIITIYGLGTKIDGLTIRTAKFAVDRFIPIVGSFLSEAVDAVVGCSAILKNGLGFIGLFILLFICILPIIKIGVLLFVYKIIGVVLQPIGSENLVEFFNQVSKSLLLILVSLVSTGIMFFITITIIVEAGNNLLMLR